MRIREAIRTEATRETAIEELVELTRTQPKIPVDDPRVANREMHRQYRNNFFMRFIETRDVIAGQADELREHRVEGYKDKLGIDLVGFFATQATLCDAVCEAIDAKEPYDRLLAGYVELLKLEREGELPEDGAEVLNEAANHPLGMEAIGHYYWDRMNPLLEEAYGYLEAISPSAAELGR